MNKNAGIKILGCLIILILLSGFTFVRNRVWDTKISLWSDVARKSPMKSRAHNNLGNCYGLLNMPFSAIQEYQKALSLDNRNLEAYYNIAANLEQVGILNQAIYYYDIFCKSAPSGYRNQKQLSCDRVINLSRKIKQ